MLDIVIRNATLVDGSRAPRRKADVGILGDRVEVIGDLSSAVARQVLDASGKIIAPGFIDMHSHGDSMLPFLPTADSKVHQGVTLEVVGNCGFSMAPFSRQMLDEMNETYAQEGGHKHVDWDTFAGFFERLRRQGTSVNVFALAGHGTIREKVMGMTDAVPTPQQMGEMKDEVRRAMESGARGLSTGLIYTPSLYARTEEIVELAKVAGKLGGIYTSHIRGEGDTLLEAIAEAVEIGRAADIPVEISHLKASGPRNWHKMPQAIEMIEKARRSGLDISADMYPYPASNTGLTSIVPAWAHVGGRDALLARLADAGERERICRELNNPEVSQPRFWDKIMISYCPANPQLEGQTIEQIAAARRHDPLGTALDLLVENRLNVDIIMFTMKDENVAMGLQMDFVAIGTDGSGYAKEGPLSGGKPHPRNFGTFPRVLGYYAREQELFSLEEAVWKMTGLPAGKLKLAQRGLLQEGYFADLVVFDEVAIRDMATFTQPHQFPQGILSVMVNGVWVVRDGVLSGQRPGVIL
ncbi:MAG: D-aminoacylase [Anaerolineae bacterium]|nr:D-aminoacylase [Anaerolineae bacterium]